MKFYNFVFLVPEKKKKNLMLVTIMIKINSVLTKPAMTMGLSGLKVIRCRLRLINTGFRSWSALLPRQNTCFPTFVHHAISSIFPWPTFPCDFNVSILYSLAPNSNYPDVRVTPFLHYRPQLWPRYSWRMQRFSIMCKLW